MRCTPGLTHVQVKTEEVEVLIKEAAEMKTTVCDLEAELASTQKDLKEVVGGDLHLSSALMEIKTLRGSLSQAQAAKFQATAEVPARFLAKQLTHANALL